MSGNRLLLDTNILIYLSKQELKLEDFASEDDVLYISVITLMEAKGYNFSNKREEVLIDTLCENLIKADLTNGVIETVISLRKINKIKLPDAIILATAIENNLKLITRNTKDFEVAAPSDIVFNPF
ncbi:MAG: type II toxin-antitoxin system VapC family toxin [Lentimicrobium sp.]